MKVLEILDVLDKHCNDLSDVNETIEKLYKRIFPKIKVFIGNETHVTESSLADLLQDKNGKGASKTDDEPETGQSDPLYTNMKELSDKEIIFLLCDWAVTTKRCGLHRIFYVVFLIRKRQIDWVTLFKSALKSNNSQTKSENTDQVLTEAIKKVIENDSELEEELTSRKRKFKLNESDEAEADSAKQTDQSLRSIKTELLPPKDESIKKKMRLDNNESLDTSNNIKSEPIYERKIASMKIEPKRKSLGALNPMNMREKIKKRSERQRMKRMRLVKLKQQQKKLKQKEQDEKIETGLYEYLFQAILLEYLETKAPYLG